MSAERSSILSLPAAYRFFQWTVGHNRFWNIFLPEYVKPAAGERVLDIGCGPADVLARLRDVDYTGFDLSPEYIAAAKRRYGSRGRFFCGDVGRTSLGQERFDLVLAGGVLHHLEDMEADRLFALARAALKPTGRLVTLDGCYVEGQSRIARWFLAHDRGTHVRTQEHYLRLAEIHFPKVEPYLRHDLLHIPYTHLILRCTT